MINFIIFLIVFGGGCFFIYMWVARQWKQSDVDEKLKKNEMEKQMAHKVNEVNHKEVIQNRKKVSDFLET